MLINLQGLKPTALAQEPAPDKVEIVDTGVPLFLKQALEANNIEPDRFCGDMRLSYQQLKRIIDFVVDRRIATAGTVDPDPYGIHGIPLAHRLEYIEEHLRTAYK